MKCHGGKIEICGLRESHKGKKNGIKKKHVFCEDQILSLKFFGKAGTNVNA